MLKNHISKSLVVCLLALASSGVLFSSCAKADDKKDVVYGRAGDQDLQLDIYGADPKQKRPAIIMLHGGGWVGGSRNDMGIIASTFSQRGYVCFPISYRLVKGDKNRYPAQIDDVQQAVRWIRAHADDYGVNPQKIGVLGASAGAHLAALLGTTDTRDNSIPELSRYSSRVQCVVDLYGPMDFTSFADAPVIDAEQRSEGMRLVAGFLGPLPENAKNYKDASPITHIDSKTAPFLIFHGAKDTLVPLVQSQQMDEALRKAGIESKLIVFPNVGHGYSDFDSIQKTFNASLDFFNDHLKK